MDEMDGWIDWTDGWMKWMDGLTDWMMVQMDGWKKLHEK
jgi:hypothetical protein